MMNWIKCMLIKLYLRVADFLDGVRDFLSFQ